MKIAVVGIRYVGLSSGLLLAQNNEVVALDIVEQKVTMLQNRVSSFEDKEIESYLKKKDLNFRATFNKEEAYHNADFVIISTPSEFILEIYLEKTVKAI